MILLTGATGHLGSHVLYELAKSNRPVRAIYRDKQKIAFVKRVFGYYQSDYHDLLKSIEWVEADITNKFSLSSCMQDVNQVYHMAGMVSFSDRDHLSMMHTNVTGTANVVNACLEEGIEKLIHVSSIAALGELADLELIHEQVIWNQGSSASAYAISKFKGEMEVWRGIHEGLQAVIVNPGVIIGPGMWMGPGKQLLTGIYEGLSYYPSGSSGYVDVRDVSRIMIQLMDRRVYGERYIISAENITHQQYLNLIADAFGLKRPHRLITKSLASIAVIGEKMRSTVTGRPARFTQRSLDIASEKLAYSNTKIREALDISFIPVSESVKFMVPLFLKDIALTPGK